MLRVVRLCFAGALLTPLLRLSAQESASLEGYVTAPGTAERFQVNGQTVTCDPSQTASSAKPACQVHRFGEYLVIHGKRDKQDHVLAANKIETFVAPDSRISGFAVIDGVNSPSLIRADGYALELTSSTKEIWYEPLKTTDQPAVNQWIEYQGEAHPGGAVIVKAVSFYPATVTGKEQHLKEKTAFDASAVKEEERQGGASKFFRGVDYKRIPAVHDETQQARIDAIGHRLVPAFQKNLPQGDPNKIDFHFQLVDSAWQDCVTMPTGTILVPAATVAKLDDDKLAAVLADNIATALEKAKLPLSARRKGNGRFPTCGHRRWIHCARCRLSSCAGKSHRHAHHTQTS